MLYALRLEYYYPKEKILEFYINQFFVSGNGHGLGVAARYYFNKSPDELNLLEAAFIAGSVKRPNYYNPFIKKSSQLVEQARERAHERAWYVLKKMRKKGFITQDAFDEAMASTLHFERGRMSYALNSVMDQVRSQLASPEIMDSLEEHGISNIATSGVRIITTVDSELQARCLYELRRALSALDVQLRGYRREAVQKEYAKLSYRGDRQIRRHAFLMGTITSIITGKHNNKGRVEVPEQGGGRGLIEVVVHFGHKQPDGIIDERGFTHLLPFLAKYTRNRWSKVEEKDLDQLKKELHVGDQVFVSVRSFEENGRALLDLERYPKVQGAAIISRKGELVAMAGGLSNRFFNRAIDAKRLMGSTFKPFLFAAALQLGWNSVDLLDNSRRMFLFMGKPYFPRPDHHSPHHFVSMSWAGVNSENVAAVWLLYHLLDHLSPPRLREVAAHLDMAPRVLGERQESYASFKRRIRDQFGVRVNGDTLDQAAFDRALDTLEPDFLFDNRGEDYRQLTELPYGLHFDDFRHEIDLQLENPELKEKERKELKLRKSMLWKSYLDIEPVFADFQHQRRRLMVDIDNRSFFSVFDREPLIQPGRGRFARDQNGHVIFTWRRTMNPDWRPLSLDELSDQLADMGKEQLQDFWESVQIEGAATVYGLQQLQAQMERERIRLGQHRPYSMETLISVRDYRIMLGLQYLVKLGHLCGVTCRLEPVLSFPLGSNVVTLADMVRFIWYPGAWCPLCQWESGGK